MTEQRCEHSFKWDGPIWMHPDDELLALDFQCEKCGEVKYYTLARDRAALNAPPQQARETLTRLLDQVNDIRTAEQLAGISPDNTLTGVVMLIEQYRDSTSHLDTSAVKAACGFPLHGSDKEGWSCNRPAGHATNDGSSHHHHNPYCVHVIPALATLAPGGE